MDTPPRPGPKKNTGQNISSSHFFISWAGKDGLLIQRNFLEDTTLSNINRETLIKIDNLGKILVHYSSDVDYLMQTPLSKSYHEHANSNDMQILYLNCVYRNS